MKKLEVYLLESGFLDITSIEQSILENNLDSWSDKNINNASWSNNAPTWSTEALLNVNYSAPEFTWLTNWLNSEWYNSVQDLSGKVVIIDFWTYSCINCIRTLPYLQKLYETYEKDWLVIIGIHAPEFQFERKIENVQKAVNDYGLTYPVVQDNDFATRGAYENRFWPAKYIIDKQWNIRYTHLGEWAYEETEQVVQYLLGLNQELALNETTSTGSKMQTPETYLGTSRRKNMTEWPSDKRNDRRLNGKWDSDAEKAMSTTSWSISINAYAREVNLVLGSDSPITGQIMIDGKATEMITVDGYNLYNLYKWDEYEDHKVTVEFDTDWVQAYAYTFG